MSEIDEQENPQKPQVQGGQIQYNAIVVGNSSAGKLELLNLFRADGGSEILSNTFGTDFVFYTCTVDSREVRLSVWDTAGEERLHRIPPCYLRGTRAIMFLFDVTKSKTLDYIDINCLGHAGEDKDDIIRILVGENHKSRPTREVTEEKANQFAEAHGMEYYEMPTFTRADGIDLLQHVAELCLAADKHREYEEEEEEERERARKDQAIDHEVRGRSGCK